MAKERLLCPVLNGGDLGHGELETGQPVRMKTGGEDIDFVVLRLFRRPRLATDPAIVESCPNLLEFLQERKSFSFRPGGIEAPRNALRFLRPPKPP